MKGELFFGGRRVGTVKAMSYSGSTQNASPARMILKSRSAGMSRQTILEASRQTGMARAMALMLRELATAETPAVHPAAPPFLVIDEVGPPYAPVPSPTPRFAQLSCLRRQRSR